MQREYNDQLPNVKTSISTEYLQSNADAAGGTVDDTLQSDPAQPLKRQRWTIRIDHIH
jgi:hypothetical protein